jgi:DNA-binding transcriptional LysR family regulator
MQHPFSSGVPALSRSAIEEPGLLSGRFWGELRTFLAVAKAKSLSRAADQVGLSRMTAGREIRRLQDAIGAQLVIFSKTGAILTPRGEQLALALQKVDQEIFALTSDLRGEGNLVEGVVRVSVTDGIGIFFLAPALYNLTIKNPRLRIEFVATNNYISFVENRTDMMIAFFREPKSEITSTWVGMLHLVPFASREYIERNGMPTISNIGQHFVIQSSQYSAKVDIWNPWRTITESARLTHSSDSSMMYGMMVRAGVGIGLLSNYQAINSYLVPLDLNCHITLPLHVIALTERLQSKPVRIVYDFVLAALSEAKLWLDPKIKTASEDGVFERGYHMLLSS